jgi:hypothetical protein
MLTVLECHLMSSVALILVRGIRLIVGKLSMTAWRGQTLSELGGDTMLLAAITSACPAIVL